ncbi:MAG TPA: TonB-dependent receptor [Puia sp.]|jgi:outer membrane receptor protein involved in Fe transport|nr:TonB-dependent receptor [Puia sp.]
MRQKLILQFASILLLSLICLPAKSQSSYTISGTVSQSVSKERVPAVSVTVKGSVAGTFTDDHGNFQLTTTQQPPITLIFSSIGFETQEVTVSNPGAPVEVSFVPSSTLGKEVVVSATRGAIRSLESPVSIERMSSTTAHEVPAPSFYDAIANMKDVDAVTSSLLFKTMGTRGFNGSGNTRMNQFVDGMDNQAPGLNFSVANINGLNELDVDNVELLPGASSALYGSGGMTGTLLMTSKDPFKYQGFSAQVKQGVNHLGDDQSSAKPYYNWTARYAKAFNNRFAFKLTADYTLATDWMASDYRNYVPVTGAITGDTRSLPNYDGINVYGDESAYFNVQKELQAISAQYAAAANAAAMAGNAPLAAQYQVEAQQTGQLAAATPANSNVTRTGYTENTLTTYRADNFKVYGGLYYKVAPTATLSLIGNFGEASTIYQGTDRYSLKDVKIGQYKVELTGQHYYVRAYTTQENAGNSYDMVAVATLLNEAYAPTATVWAPNYLNAYAQAFGADLLAGQSPTTAYANASAVARGYADQGRLTPGTAAFNTAADSLKKLAIPMGGKFNDQTDLYVGEAMYNFANQVKWIDITVGAATREFVLNSHGTIFADTAGRININETGAFAQLQKGFWDDFLKLSLSGRYDKNSNFKGRFTPRATALLRVAKDNYIRASFQTAYRFPTTQNQYINLQTGSARLIGGLPQFITAYGLNDGQTYDTATLNKYLTTGATPTPFQYQTFKPETVASWELGYKGLIGKNLLLDVYGFYAQYTNFIGLTVLVKDPLTLGQTAANTFGIYTNSPTKVNTGGAGIGLDYSLPMGWIISGNYAYSTISSKDVNQQTDFNTPKHKFNLTVANYSIAKVYGFNLTYRWQDAYLYQSSFITGMTPAFGTLDAQISMKLPKLDHSLIKIGASNLLNYYHVDAIGDARMGGLYYISFGYNVL